MQGIERLRNSLIAYSLGNCVFDQKYEQTQTGFILRVQFHRSDGLSDVEIIPFRIHQDTYMLKLLGRKEKDELKAL